MRFRWFLVVAALASSAMVLGPPAAAQELPYALFERYIEALRQLSGIPGISTAVNRNGRIEWERGFGHQDVDRAIPATPDTPYPIGGVTESFTAVLLGVCTDRHSLDVDEVMTRFVLSFPEAKATVRHVLAHASEGPVVGDHFRYDLSTYVSLTPVVDQCSARPFRVAIVDEIFDRLGMQSSAPGLDATTAPARALYDDAHLQRYAATLSRVAVPYRVEGNRVVQSEISERSLDAANGVVSTVRDLARFETALDNGVPLSSYTLSQMWSPANFGLGPLPTGLGWFTTVYENKRVVWSFGLIPSGGSALIIKVPSKNMTLFMLANSPGLTAGAKLEQGDLLTSAFAKVFLRLFVG